MPIALPGIFVSHGAPTLYLDPQPTRTFLMELGQRLPRPRAVVCVSAHWTTDAPRVTTAAWPETIHDFYGFPEALYAVRYEAPGDPALAGQVLDRLARAGIAAEGDPGRGLDHGAWVPLGLMYPEADIPAVQLSVQPGRDAAWHLALGQALADLGRDGVLLLASGSATHNLRDVRWEGDGQAPPAYVAAFDTWLRENVEQERTEALLAYRSQGPYAAQNHPSQEHILPLFVPCGAGGTPRLLHQGYTYGVLSMAAYAWEAHTAA